MRKPPSQNPEASTKRTGPILTYAFSTLLEEGDVQKDSSVTPVFYTKKNTRIKKNAGRVTEDTVKPRAGQLDCYDLIKESLTQWDSHMGDYSYQI